MCVLKMKVTEYLFSFQEIFKDASVLLYKATHKRVFFKSISVILPYSWDKKDSYTIMSTLASSTSYIKVGNDNYSPGPAVFGSKKCGDAGLYMYLPAEKFVLTQNSKGPPTGWGNHGKRQYFLF